MKKNQGAILILALLGLTTISILAGAFVHMGISDQRFSERSQAGVQAFYLSESAIDRGLTWLRGQLSAPTWTDRRVINGGWQALGADGAYLTAIDPDDGNRTSFVKRYTIEGWGAGHGTLTRGWQFGQIGGGQWGWTSTLTVANAQASRQSRMVVQTESFAQYAYFTDEEKTQNGLTVWFVTGDRLTGPVHTNGRFSMYGRPVFEGPVSSVADDIHRWGGPQFTQPQFREPPKLGAPHKEFPQEYPRSIVDSANDGGSVFQGDTAVTLLSEGRMRVTNAQAGLRDAVMDLPSNGVLYVEGGGASLQGTLKGQLTVGASGDIRLEDSVKYSDDPRRNPASTDVLGIVAGQNVVIPTSAPHDIQIDGVVMAMNSSFGAEDWWQGAPKGTISLYGGVIQKKRGPVGRFNGATGQKLSGYSKDYRYDTRMGGMAPPAFPTTGDYRPLVWQGDSGS